MNHRQLRYLCEIKRQGFNISLAAAALNTSQPGISRHVRLLEEELGCDLLVRRRNRILGFTAEGQAVFDLATRIAELTECIRSVPQDLRRAGASELRLATTATMARYVLPKVAKQFQLRFPRVKLLLVHGDAARTAGMVVSGEADLGVTTQRDGHPPDVALLPYLTLYRNVITPPDHPLLKRRRKLTLRDLAAFPMINLNTANAGGQAVINAFRAAGVQPNIVLEASEVATLKACVAQRLGIATLPINAFDPEEDSNIRMIDAQHLFQPTCNFIVVRRDRYDRGHIPDLIEALAPAWTRAAVKSAIDGRQGGQAVTIAEVFR